MEQDKQTLLERLEAATSRLEQALQELTAQRGAGEVKHLSATVEVGTSGEEIDAASALHTLRRTLPAATVAMLSKQGIGDGPVEIRTLDAALAGLSLEQRIAVKTQLLRAGAIA